MLDATSSYQSGAREVVTIVVEARQGMGKVR